VGAFAELDQSQGEAVTETDTNETKREQLRRKVAESRSALTKPQTAAGEPPEGYRALAADYPFALLLGGLALGAIAGAVLPRRAGRKLIQGAVAAAGVAGELGRTYGRQALDTVGDAAGAVGDAAGSIGHESRSRLGTLGEKLVELGEAFGEAASAYGRKAADVAGETATAAGSAAGKAADKAGHLAEDGAANARETGLKIARQVIRLTSQLRH
jgi:hypothetical protein